MKRFPANHAMSGQHWENYDVKRETVHYYPRNVDRCCTWPDVVAGISARFSKFALLLFCYITNRLMTRPLGNSEFCFPRISLFPETSSRETMRFSGNKIHCSPRDESLSVNCIFTTTAEILARSLANFYRQYADRHMNLKFVRRVSERERAIRPFVIVKNKLT